jgi:hypothetical protein
LQFVIVLWNSIRTPNIQNFGSVSNSADRVCQSLRVLIRNSADDRFSPLCQNGFGFGRSLLNDRDTIAKRGIHGGFFLMAFVEEQFSGVLGRFSV